MKRLFCLLIAFLFLSVQVEAEDLPVRSLSLNETRHLVLLNNFEIQARKLGMESARSLFEGEKKSVWEPVLVAGVDRLSNERENNTEEFIRQGVEDFSEDNTLYSLRVEQPLITGGSLSLSYNVDNLVNNLQEQRDLDFQEKEYDSFAGVTLVQPLLKNGGLDMGGKVVEIARRESDVAFQEYRRQLMQSLGMAEAAYWELTIAQERVRLREKSVNVARLILEDNRARVQAGKMSELEVQEAEAGLATRQSQLLEARQSLSEASDRLISFFGLEGVPGQVYATEKLSLKVPEMEPELELEGLAMELHPDVLIRGSRIRQDRLRLDYAKNQRLPQLDLRASYGFNGLGEDQTAAWESVDSMDYPSWTVGVEFRVPLGGGNRKQAELTAAHNRLDQSRIDENSVMLQVLRALRTARSRVHNFYRQAENYTQVSALNEEILKTELTRLDVGRSDSRQVLEAEEKLTRARESLAASLTRLAVAQVELQLTSGTLLKKRGLDPMEPSGVPPLPVRDAGGRP